MLEEEFIVVNIKQTATKGMLMDCII